MTVPSTYGELVPTGGGDSIPLFKRKLLIGRRSNCDIMLSFPNVSSNHCELELLNGYWHIADLGSANGIKVNHERCDTKWLMPGDTITIAKHHYEICYTARGTPPVNEDADPFAKSLMEKAGLTRSELRPSSRKPTPPAVPQAPAKPSNEPESEDDEALKWLGES